MDGQAMHTWLSQTSLKRTPATVIRTFSNVPHLLDTTPKDKTSHTSHACYDHITPCQRQLVELSCAWAAEGAAATVETAKNVMSLPLPEDVRTMPIGQRYWAMKKNLPAARMPLDLKKLLIQLYNRVPHASPKSAVTEIQKDERFKDDIFVRYMVTSARVKTYFASLKSKKKGDNQIVPESAAASEVAVKVHGVREMKALIKKRGIQVVGGVSRMRAKQLEEVLADDDKGRENNDQWDCDAIAQEMAETSNRYDLDDSTSLQVIEAEAHHGHTLEEPVQGIPEEGAAESNAWAGD
jgi:hypothetical protein